MELEVKLEEARAGYDDRVAELESHLKKVWNVISVIRSHPNYTCEKVTEDVIVDVEETFRNTPRVDNHDDDQYMNT